MTPVEILGWSLVMLAGLAGSAMWSGTETGFYCLSRVRLDVRLHRHGDRAAVRVRDELSDPNRLLSTILLGNNLCNYAGTLGLTMLLEGSGLSDGATIALQMVVLTPLLLVFGESLPKEVFRLNADSWPYALSPVIKFVRTVATVVGVLPAAMFISRLAAPEWLVIPVDRSTRWGVGVGCSGCWKNRRTRGRSAGCRGGSRSGRSCLSARRWARSRCRGNWSIACGWIGRTRRRRTSRCGRRAPGCR